MELSSRKQKAEKREQRYIGAAGAEVDGYGYVEKNSLGSLDVLVLV
jgi:hypothetical protein